MNRKQEMLQCADKYIAERDSTTGYVLYPYLAGWEKADETMLERACAAYCNTCESDECYKEGNCEKVIKFKKELTKED